MFLGPDLCTNETKFLKQVKGLCKAYNGLGMVAYQGIKAFQIWSERRQYRRIVSGLKECIG